MFGWKDEFQYFQCANCGCLQIASPPADLGRFYPENYSGYQGRPLPQRGLRSRIASVRDLWAATGRGFLGALINKVTPARSDTLSLANVPAKKSMRILDVGCGSGSLLSILHRAGFKHLVGIDPLFPADAEILEGLNVRRLELDSVSESFDLIMLHHVFEHLPDGLKSLRLCRERLLPRGKILLRFPVADSDAWERYRENWVQLDCPRHLFLHTRHSFETLASAAGLTVKKWLCDSSAFQFWGSELFLRGLPLHTTDGASVLPERYFSAAEMKSFDAAAKLANLRGRGDQAVVVLENSQGPSSCV